MVTERPLLSLADAVCVAADVYGVSATSAKDLSSDRDRTFAILDADQRAIAILKVSNRLEDPAVLDMEAEAVLHVAVEDPELRVAVPWRPCSTGNPGPAHLNDRPESLRAQCWHGDTAHWVRLYDVLPGHSRSDARDLSDDALEAWGASSARLTNALRGFSHAKALRPMPWDVQNALAGRFMANEVPDPELRAAVLRVLKAFEQRVTPVWPLLRTQVLHADFTVHNALSDDDGFVIGVIDFGDMGYTTIVSDLAAVLDSVAGGREGSEALRAGGLVLQGFQRHLPLEEPELEVLPLAWATRTALNIMLASWRGALGVEDSGSAERLNDWGLRTIRAFEGIGWDRAAQALVEPGRRGL